MRHDFVFAQGAVAIRVKALCGKHAVFAVVTAMACHGKAGDYHSRKSQAADDDKGFIQIFHIVLVFSEGCKDRRDTGTLAAVGGLVMCTGAKSDIGPENGTKGAGPW